MKGKQVSEISTKKLLNDDSVYSDAIYGWSKKESELELNARIRVTFKGLKPKTGYAYKEPNHWLGIRYTWRLMRWWSLLNYNNPLIKLEVERVVNPYGANVKETHAWVTLWEKVSA